MCHRKCAVRGSASSGECGGDAGRAGLVEEERLVVISDLVLGERRRETRKDEGLSAWLASCTSRDTPNFPRMNLMGVEQFV